MYVTVEAVVLLWGVLFDLCLWNPIKMYNKVNKIEVFIGDLGGTINFF